jgi:Na+-translocating ferredoxin:NAD+ oxidoreductase RnfG subunit
MNKLNTLRTALFILTLFFCLSLNAAEEENQKDSSPVEIDVKEFEAQCEELYLEQIVPDEQDRKHLVEKCVSEKKEKLKKFADEHG